MAGRKKLFSLIFVPDQEQNPRSMTMSYAKGRIFIGVLAVLSVHAILGAFGYYRIIRLESSTRILQEENTDLKAQNKLIEQIIRDVNELKNTDIKIRKAFGGSLGLEGYGQIQLENLGLGTSGEVASPALSRTSSRSPIKQVQNGLYFLRESQSEYFNPEYLPTLLPVEGFLTTHFQKGGWFVGRKHNGIDIAASKGTVIRAAGSGYVVMSEWTPDYGNVVMISHGRGMISLYGHAMRLLVDQGFSVTRGQPIALLGNSGMTSLGPHLHLEIWKDGECLDPELVLFALPGRDAGTGS